MERTEDPFPGMPKLARFPPFGDKVVPKHDGTEALKAARQQADVGHFANGPLATKATSVANNPPAMSALPVVSAPPLVISDLNSTASTACDLSGENKLGRTHDSVQQDHEEGEPQPMESLSDLGGSIETDEDLQQLDPADSEEEKYELLEKYKTYVLGQLPQFEHGPEDLREHLDREGWPTAWESLQKIEACKDGLNWTWGEADNHLLYKLTKRWEISSKVMAGFFFIGMRPKQCEIQFKKIEDEYDARYEVGSGHFAQRQE